MVARLRVPDVAGFDVADVGVGRETVLGEADSAVAEIGPDLFLVAGYNVYRGTTPGGEDLSTPINTSVVAGDAYLDISVAAGATYYYVVETVGVNGQQSVPSNEASSTIPSP